MSTINMVSGMNIFTSTTIYDEIYFVEKMATSIATNPVASVGAVDGCQAQQCSAVLVNILL